MQQHRPPSTLYDILSGDVGLQDRLAAIVEPERFQEALRARAVALGIELDGLVELRHCDPLMVLAREPVAHVVSAWPSAAWMPIRVASEADEFWIDWAHFGGRANAESFFEDSARIAARLPFNRQIGLRMRLADFISGAGSQAAMQPDGFIFHMSRCGSTLVSNMLRALDGSIVISEAPPLDAMVQLHAYGLPLERSLAALRAMIVAYGRPRGGEHRYFLKLDAWHARDLWLFRLAYPDVPWVFLYRDPLEVLASQAMMPGMQVVPGMLPAHIFGIDAGTCESSEEYGARALSAICFAALEHYAAGQGLIVNYSELPGTVATRILPHFGILPTAADCEAMRIIAGRDSKAPSFSFESDVERKQRDASARTRELADRFLAATYRRLEELRMSQMAGATARP